MREPGLRKPLCVPLGPESVIKMQADAHIVHMERRFAHGHGKLKSPGRGALGRCLSPDSRLGLQLQARGRGGSCLERRRKSQDSKPE